MNYWTVSKTWDEWARIRQDGQLPSRHLPAELAAGDRFVAISINLPMPGTVLALGNVLGRRGPADHGRYLVAMTPLQPGSLTLPTDTTAGPITAEQFAAFESQLYLTTEDQP
ncbi:MAG: hypothetical protein KGJ86_15850 [Chloroflexota bacterium]|nr:hypothetical protein [Chloroflexota bacterium]